MVFASLITVFGAFLSRDRLDPSFIVINPKGTKNTLNNGKESSPRDLKKAKGNEGKEKFGRKISNEIWNIINEFVIK